MKFYENYNDLKEALDLGKLTRADISAFINNGELVIIKEGKIVYRRYFGHPEVIDRCKDLGLEFMGIQSNF